MSKTITCDICGCKETKNNPVESYLVADLGFMIPLLEDYWNGHGWIDVCNKCSHYLGKSIKKAITEIRSQ